MYGTTFRIGGEEIRVSLEEKKAAEEIFLEAQTEGRAALLGQNLGNGLVEFVLGNIPPGTPCEVSVDCAFTASSSGSSSTFIKFPLNVCMPRGTLSCVMQGFDDRFEFSFRIVIHRQLRRLQQTLQALTTNLRVRSGSDQCLQFRQFSFAMRSELGWSNETLRNRKRKAL
jgi:hypothetical protein